MEYVFQALVVDDESQMNGYFDVIKMELKDAGIDINFDIARDEKAYQEFINSKNYDLLLFDFNLTRGYSIDKPHGNEFIKEFRKDNRISKIIFYSSSFIYLDAKKKYSIGLPEKEIYDLINDFQVDKIVSRENISMMKKAIKDCCEELDILPVMLTKMLLQYKKAGITTMYIDSNGEEIDANELISEIMKDKNEGRLFKERFTKAILNTVFSFKY